MDVEQIYKDANAYLEGYFLLSSGKYSASYFYTKTTKLLTQELAKPIGSRIQLKGYL